MAVIASGAGFRGDDLVTAVAVGLAESGGATAVVGGPNWNGTYDHGVWQINSVHRHLFEQYPEWWVPENNARMAFAVFSDQGWDAWSAYNNLSWWQHKPTAKAAADELTEIPGEDGIITESPLDPLIGVANGVIGMAQAVFKAGAWMANPDNWARLAIALVGGGLIVGGLVVVAKKGSR